MNSTIILIVAASVASIVSVFFTFYLNWVKNKIQTREEERTKKVLLDLQRERIESQIYELVGSQKMDNLLITGSEELFMTSSKERPKLSTSVCDDSFYKSLGVDIKSISIEPFSACVVMPFHPKFNKTYESIKKATKESGYVCHRSDEVFVTGDILRNIIQMILQAQVVIAVLDGNNPNVFYEVGIAHSVGKPVIFVANKNRLEKSFDIDHNRMVLYNNTGELEKELTTFLKSLNEDGRR